MICSLEILIKFDQSQSFDSKAIKLWLFFMKLGSLLPIRMEILFETLNNSVGQLKLDWCSWILISIRSHKRQLILELKILLKLSNLTSEIKFNLLYGCVICTGRSLLLSLTLEQAGYENSLFSKIFKNLESSVKKTKLKNSPIFYYISLFGLFKLLHS